jgi:hypothetical protein
MKIDNKQDEMEVSALACMQGEQERELMAGVEFLTASHGYANRCVPSEKFCSVLAPTIPRDKRKADTCPLRRKGMHSTEHML